MAVDVDEVLGQFLLSLNHFLEEHHGMRYSVKDYSEYVFAKVWGCSTERSNEIVHEFFESEHFAAGVPPVPGAFSSLCRLRDQFDLQIVTSRQHVIQTPTLKWIETNFPGVFSAVHFGNHFALEGQSRKKSEICKAIGAQVRKRGPTDSPSTVHVPPRNDLPHPTYQPYLTSSTPLAPFSHSLAFPNPPLSPPRMCRS